jgi:hypothetical protein
MAEGVFRYDRYLSNLSFRRQNPEAGMVAERVFPNLPVDEKSGHFPIYGTENLTPQDDLRAPGTEAKIARWSVGTPGNYNCDGHALKDSVARENQSDTDPSFDLLEDTTIGLTDKVVLNQEVALVTALAAGMTSASVALQTATPWNDDTMDPLAIIKTQILAVALRVGIKPNIFVASEPVWGAIALNKNIRGLITGAGNLAAAVITREQFAALLGVQEVIVASGVKNTANEGQAASNAWIWGETALLAVRASSPGRRIVSLGYHFVWRKALSTLAGPGAVGGGGYQLVERYWDQPIKADWVEVHKHYDQVILAKDAGCLFTDCLA